MYWQAGGSSRGSLLEQSQQAEASGDCISAVEKLHHHHDVQGPSGMAAMKRSSMSTVISVGKIGKPMVSLVLAVCLATAGCPAVSVHPMLGACYLQGHPSGGSSPLQSFMGAVCRQAKQSRLQGAILKPRVQGILNPQPGVTPACVLVCRTGDGRRPLEPLTWQTG